MADRTSKTVSDERVDALARYFEAYPQEEGDAELALALRDLERLREEDRQWDKTSLVAIVHERDRLRELLWRIQPILNAGSEIAFKVEREIGSVHANRDRPQQSETKAPQSEVSADLSELKRLAGHYGGYAEKIMRAAANEIEQRRVEVEKYKAWAASCDPVAPETECEHRETNPIADTHASWCAECGAFHDGSQWIHPSRAVVTPEFAAEFERGIVEKAVAEVQALAGDRTDAYYSGFSMACEEINHRLHAAWDELPVKSEARHCGPETPFDQLCGEPSCENCYPTSASTGDTPPAPTSPVECPKCRTQLAFEGDVCGLCSEEES